MNNPDSTRSSRASRRLRPAPWTLSLIFFAAFGVVTIGPKARVHAQGTDNAVGVAKAMNAAGDVRSAGSYSAYTGSTSRTIPDLVVPGGVGAYPLVFARTSTSRYVPGDEGDGGAFGPAGSWRHSYRWGMYLDNPGGSPAVWRVHYPDGGVVKFTTMPVSAPASGAATPPPDRYMRSKSPGVSDRLEQAINNVDLILHRHDGGTVYFQNQGGTTYRVWFISDPYNQSTNFNYYPSGAYAGKLQSITEPAGRSLTLGYVTFNGQVVLGSVTASNGQSVAYHYGIVSAANGGAAASGVTALTGVTYTSDTDASNNPCQAVYVYQGDNTGAGGRPLLLTCNDPHFPGAMPRIRYAFVQGSSASYGQLKAEIDDASLATVSQYQQSNLTETTGDGASAAYSFPSYLIASQQDHDGNLTRYGYDANSFLNSVTNANGHNVAITRDPYVGKRTAISRTDTNGQSLTTTFDYGSTSGTPYPLQPYWVLNITDPRGQPTKFTRDSAHQVLRIDYPDKTYETMAYNGLGQVTSHRLTNGNVLSYTFDGSGRLTQATDAANGTSRYTNYYYDGCDRLFQTVDFNGKNTFFAYNGRHQVTQLKHTDGTHLDYTYDTYGNRTSASDELQHVTTFTYDNHRRPTSVVAPVNAGGISTRTVTFSYEHGSDTTGNANTHRGYGTLTLPSGNQVKRVYTGQGRLRSVTKAYGKSDATTDTYTYDGLGHPLTVVDANGITQATCTYDVLDRKSKLTDANGHATTWGYYPAGNQFAGWLQTVTAPGSAVGANKVTNYNTYDLMGRLTYTTDASGQYSGWAYDANGRLSAVGDQNGAYTYGYDADSRVNSLTYPVDNTTQTWGYDPVGNATSYKNRNGDTKTLTYDGRNRPTAASWSYNAAPAQSWSYDAASRLTDVNNWYVASHRTFDDSGLPLSEADYNGLVQSGAVTNTTSFSYDKDGDLTGMTYPAGDQPNWTYDDQNRCIGLTHFSELYFQGERVTGRTLANSLTTEYHYQNNNRISEVWQHRGGMDNPQNTSYPGSNVSVRDYGYAPDGQMTWTARRNDGGTSGSAWEDGSGENYAYAPNGAVTEFGIADLSTYQSNANNQGDSAANPAFLTEANGGDGTGSSSDGYTYDADGNRSQARQFGGSTFGYSADGLNRYSGSTYDGNGCTTHSALGWTYAYDAEGQMTSAIRQSDGTGYQFAYDGAGRLIYQTGGANPTIFCYAGSARIEERSLANNASLYRYFADAPGGDSIVFRQATNTQARLYYQYDAVGNTTHVSDDGGNVVEQYLYDAYGLPYVYDKTGNTYDGQTSPSDNRYLWHGASAYEWLPAPELYYCRARMYLPVHGRWLQPDPLGFAAGDLNLYRYCGNDPVNGVDPSGLDGNDAIDDKPKLADGGGSGILRTGDTPIGSNIPSVTFVQSNDYGSIEITNIPWQGGVVDAQSSPSVTAVGGLSMMSPEATGAYHDNRMTVLGTGQSSETAYNEANSQNVDVVYSNRGYFGDIVMDVYTKLFGSYNNEDAIDLAAFASPHGGDLYITGYSQGSALIAAATDYGLQATNIDFNAAPITSIAASNAAAAAGATYTYTTHYYDIINLIAPSLNPLQFLSGLVPGYNVYVHIETYPPYAPSPPSQP